MNTVDINSNQDEFWSKKPFPHVVIDNFLSQGQFEDIQKEILDLPLNEFDRYQNPFEMKYTLRDKTNFPQETSKLFTHLQSEEFLSCLKGYTGLDLKLDISRHYWGVHLFYPGDKLDIHLDAGFHPKNKNLKLITFGLYLSKDYNESFDGQLELWSGDKANTTEVAFIDNKVVSIPCFGNKAVIFANTDNAWHGAPTNYKGTEETKRIFLTISYLFDASVQENKNVLLEIEKKHNVGLFNPRSRAYFPAVRNVVDSPEMNELRLRRASEEATSVYRYNK